MDTINNIMGIFDIIQGASSSINQFTGAMGGNQLVPPLEVDDGGLVGDAFDWIKSSGDLGQIAGNLLQNTYAPVAIRRSLTGLPYGGQRPVSNIGTRFKLASSDQRDWRTKLIVPIENPIYNILGTGPLAPLKRFAGVTFPYTPQIQTSYTAEYEDVHPTHSNYATPAYNKSKTDNITISADFSANDADEAVYCMAVIHFFRTVTKMFYGNDKANNGRPPPILILNAYGTYMFNNVPVVCKSASLTLPKEVDYVPAVPTSGSGGSSLDLKGFDLLTQQVKQKVNNIIPKILGGQTSGQTAGNASGEDISYVPTQFSMEIQLQPIYSRTAIAESFSLEKFATGSLTKNEGFI